MKRKQWKRSRYWKQTVRTELTKDRSHFTGTVFRKMNSAQFSEQIVDLQVKEKTIRRKAI